MVHGCADPPDSESHAESPTCSGPAVRAGGARRLRAAVRAAAAAELLSQPRGSRRRARCRRGAIDDLRLSPEQRSFCARARSRADADGAGAGPDHGRARQARPRRRPQLHRPDQGLGLRCQTRRRERRRRISHARRGVLRVARFTLAPRQHAASGRNPDGDCRGLHAGLQIQGVLVADSRRPGREARLSARPSAPMLPHIQNYDELYREFRWQVPARYNIGIDVCDRWAECDPDRLALLNVLADGTREEIRFGWLKERSARLANALSAHGVARGDRVAILLPQMPEVVISHVAVYKLGAIALPLAVLFGVDALSYRLQNSGAKAVMTNAQGAAKIAEIRENLPELRLVLSTDGPADGASGFAETIERAAAAFTPVATGPDDPAMMIYTSGTTGPPKGALHGHRVLLGHLPGVELPHDFFPQPGDRFWTPSDWAWAGGLLDVLLPSLHFGVPVVAKKIEKFEWGRSALGLVINEFYGQTECNLVLSSCASIGVSRPGAIGKPVPGHRVGA